VVPHHNTEQSTPNRYRLSTAHTEFSYLACGSPGLKAWVLADSASSYCLVFDIKTTSHSGPLFEGTQVCSNLVAAAGLNHSRRVLVTDNYYTSVQLSETMLNQGIYTMGIVRQSRVPEGRNECNHGRVWTDRAWSHVVCQFSAEESKLAVRGDSKTLYNPAKDLISVCWRDARDVFMISNATGTIVAQLIILCKS